MGNKDPFQRYLEHENEPKYKVGELIIWNKDEKWGSEEDKNFQVSGYTYDNGWEYNGVVFAELDVESKGLPNLLVEEFTKSGIPENQLVDRSKYHELSKKFPKRV